MAEAAGRLPDPAVEARLARLDEVLAGLEDTPGPALEAVRLLTEVYGEALARVLDHADERMGSVLTGDELLGHLLVLHEIHPEPAETRAARAVEKLRPAVRERGGDLVWSGVDGQVARVRLDGGGGCGSGCGGGSADVVAAVRAAVLAVAPELESVEVVTAEREAPSAFVPLSTIKRRAVPQEAR
ncbi:NifU family protein [Streptomyces echinatus]|uniref:NifU family protein n=1 Tax=Streptomyces echinatus TaxID=67293 RepID=UPI0037A31FF2